MVNEKSSAVGVNIQEKATMIWNVADVLRGPFKPHEYGLVILPMTVVKRFHDCLLPTHDAVIEQYEKVKKLAVIDGFLTRASGYGHTDSSYDAFQHGQNIFRPTFCRFCNQFCFYILLKVNLRLMSIYDLRVHISRLRVIVVLHYPLYYSAKIGISQGFYIVAPENVIIGRFLTPTEHGDKY